MWFLLLQMSFPPMMAIIVMALYSIVDRAFIGNVVGVDALSGLSAAFPAQIAAVAIGLLPGLGGMSVVSRALGARDTRQASRAIGSCLAILAPIYLIIAAAGLLRLDELTTALGASSNTAPYAREYLLIILPGGIFTMLAIAANNLFMAEGRPGSATIVLAGGAILYDTSNVLHHYPEDRHVGAALQLFASVALLFWYILQFFLSSRD